MRRISIAIAPLIIFLLTGVAYAQTAAQLQAELNLLLQQLQTLQAQLGSGQTSGNSSTVVTIPGAAGLCPSLGRALARGASGSDVEALQQFLVRDGSLLATPIGYFGPMTEIAVQRFQARMRIVMSGTPASTGYGAVGPATRAAIARECTRTTTTTTVPGAGCTLDGVTVAHGASADFYSTNTAPGSTNCSAYKATRQCTNGTFSGNSAFRYRSCTVSAEARGACNFNGVVMANGETRNFYRQEVVGSNQTCQSSVRTCVNGTVGGSSDYPYPTCNRITGPVSCNLDGVVIPDGQSLGFYKQKKVLFGQVCSAFQGTRACSGGVLSGDSDYRYSTCSVAGAESCTVTAGSATTTVPHGASRDFWSDNSVPYTDNCESKKLTRTCNDGIMSGSSSFRYPSCAVVPEKSCTLDGVSVPGGDKRTFYTARSVAASASCAAIDQARTCTNGVLSGGATYKFAFCAKVGQRYCVIDGTYIAHGGSGTFYSTERPAFGSSCSQFDGTRSCNDGTPGGSATYQYASCIEPVGASCVLDGVSVSHGQSRTFYSRSFAPSGGTCAQVSQSRMCIDGTLSGDIDFDTSSCSD